METVTIPKAEYEKMQEDLRFLQCLRNAGVDNWPGFDEACHEFNGEDEE